MYEKDREYADYLSWEVEWLFPLDPRLKRKWDKVGKGNDGSEKITRRYYKKQDKTFSEKDNKQHIVAKIDEQETKEEILYDYLIDWYFT